MKKILATLLAVLVVVSIVGCGPTVTPSVAEYVVPDMSTDVKLNLTWMMASQSMLSAAETPAMKYVAEKFNVSLNMTELTPADHDVQLELNISGNKIKNIVSRIDINLANEYGSYGAFLDLAPYIENGHLPNIKAMIDKALEENSNNASLLYDDEGHIFRIPSYNENPMPIYNFSYNQEAFAAVGYPNPQTWDDVYNALVAIKGGKENVYPFQMRTLGTDQLGTQITNFIISFTGGYANGQEFIGYDPKTDQFVFAMETEGYKEAIKFFNKMYNAGLIDPAYSTASITTIHEAMRDGTCVMTCDYMGGFTGVTGYEEYTSAFVPMSLPQAEGQQQTHGFSIAQFDAYAGTAISAEVAKNPVLLGRILQVLDYMYSEEFINLQWYNPDVCEGSFEAGVTDPTKYTYQLNADGLPIYKDNVYAVTSLADMQNMYFCWSLYSAFYNLNDPICDASKAPYNRYYEFRDKLITETDKYVDVPLPIFTPGESKKINACESNMFTVFNMRMVTLLTGKFASDAEFDAQWKQTVNAVKDQGADTLVDIYNDAYQRMK